MTNIMEEMQAHVERHRGNEKRLLRFRGVTYYESDVIVLCEPSTNRAVAETVTLLLVAYDEESGITELFPLGIEVLRALNPEKCAAVCETVDKLRNPLICVDPS